MMKMVKLAVGKPYPLSIPPTEGAVFSWTKAGLDLKLFFNGPDASEITAVRRGDVYVGLLTENPVMAIYWCFGSTLEGDAYFHFSRFEHENRLNEAPDVPVLHTEEARLMLLITLIDRRTRTVKCLRGVTLTPEQSRFMAINLRYQMDNFLSKASYAAFVDAYAQLYPCPTFMKNSAKHYNKLG